MRIEQVEAFFQRRQHAQRQHIDFENAQRIEIILVPLNGGALLHRRIHDGHDLVETIPGDDEAAAMLSEVSGKAGKFAGKF